MKLESLPKMTETEWDQALAATGCSMIYQHSAWLQFLLETQPHTGLQRFRLSDSDGKCHGYFAALLQQKGPFLLMGSPLSGWFTDFMGPAATSALNLPDFLNEVENWARSAGVSFIQLGHPRLPPGPLRAAKYGVNEMSVFRCALCSTEAEQWRRLTGKCRNRLRKGMQGDLTIERCTDGSIVEDYYLQHVDVFARQGLPPKYSKSTVCSLVKNMGAADQLLALRILHGRECIGTGLFVFDRHNIYSFGIASTRNRRALCPSERLYWEAILFGIDRGLAYFYMGGQHREPPSGGSFKRKFNVEVVPVYRYSKPLGFIAPLAYGAFRGVAAGRQWVKQLSHRAGRR